VGVVNKRLDKRGLYSLKKEIVGEEHSTDEEGEWLKTEIAENRVVS